MFPSFKHTMATLGYKAGLDLPTIQRLLGHTDSATTQIYAELDQDSVMQAHKKHMGI